MNRHWFSRGRVNTQHNLFVSESKHLYLDAKGNLKSQKKPLDRRTAGAKRILTRLCVLDVDSGAVYGEVHDDTTAADIATFLLRAWHPKAGHFFRGVPRQLNVPAKIIDSNERMRHLRMLTDPAGVEMIDVLPSGFGAGVHALRRFEESINESLWGHTNVPLSTLQAISAVMSYTTIVAAVPADPAWDASRPLPTEARSTMEALHAPGYWRQRQFEYMFPQVVAECTDLGSLSSEQLVAMGHSR